MIIVAAATYGYNKRSDEWAWRGPLALQWVFPVSRARLSVDVPETDCIRHHSWSSSSSPLSLRGGSFVVDAVIKPSSLSSALVVVAELKRLLRRLLP